MSQTLVLRQMVLLSRVPVAQNLENADAFSKSIITNVHNNKKRKRTPEGVRFLC